MDPSTAKARAGGLHVRRVVFDLVQAGDFLPELYYRLNVVLLDVTSS